MTAGLKILLHNDRTTELAGQVASAHPQLKVIECNTYRDLPSVIETHVPDVVYTVRFDSSSPYPRDALFSENGPQWVANGGAGTDHLGHWDPDRTIVTNAAGIAADMMAEYAFGCFLHFTLDVPGLQQDKSNRVWAARFVTPLKGKTLLIIGLGHTGRAVAARAKAFGMHVIGTRATPRDMPNVDEVGSTNDLLRMLPRADFIFVSTPLIPSTRGLIGEREVSAMKPGVVIVDVSRGSVMQQSAVLRGLQNGQIAAAGLDVFETEPLPPDNPLWGEENVIISPHCSSVSSGWEQASFDLFLENLALWLSNEPLKNVVDPSRGY